MYWLVPIFSIILITLAYRKLRNHFVLRKIPAPPALPILGLAVEIIRDNQVTLFERFRKYAKQHEGIYRIPLMFYDVVQIYNTEDAEQLLSSNAHQGKAYLYNFLKNWLGTGLLTSEGEKWRSRRKLLTPTFHFQILQEFLVTFNQETKRFVSDIKQNIEQCNRDIKPLIVSFTMKTICETAMGLDDIDEDAVVDYRKRMKNYGEIFVKKTQRVWYLIPFIYNLSNMAVEEKKLLRDMHNFSYTVIDNRMKKRNGNDVKKRKMAMLDLLLNLRDKGAQIDEIGIQEEVDTFIFEGHDTTAAAISFILLLLAYHPEIQEKAAAEVEEVFHGDDRDCTFEDLAKLEYLECCIKESLRLYPSVPIISRECSENYTTSTGYSIPKGTALNIHIFDLHRDPKVFPNPEKFDPERFKADNSTNRPPFAYIPFSGGPRNCIGQKFAMLELKTFLSGILRNFKLEAIDTPHDLIFECDLILSTVNPIRIRFLKSENRSIIQK